MQECLFVIAQLIKDRQVIGNVEVPATSVYFKRRTDDGVVETFWLHTVNNGSFYTYKLIHEHDMQKIIDEAITAAHRRPFLINK